MAARRFSLARRRGAPYHWRADQQGGPVFPAPSNQTAAPEAFTSMNKADLVNLVAARTEQTKTDVALVVDALIDTIIDSVVDGKKVSILGFGSFEPRDRSARQGLNPKTGEKIKIDAKRVPAFTAGKMFKDKVQGLG
ncbi:MAG: HU family DNA-binding protein [Chitinophagaceae bacterium]|nr:HU family DNA-binding protein [Chitinophagaceae bacterium]